MINSFVEIDNLIREITKNNKYKIAVAAAEDENILEAVFKAKKLGIADAVLVGDKNKIMKIIKEHSIEAEGVELIHRDSVKDAAEKAVELVYDGYADVLMKGLLDTSIFLKAVLDKEKGIRRSCLLSYAGIFEIHGFNRLLIITDPAFNLVPTLEEKELIMKNSITLAHALGNKCPKIAFICPIEKVNSKMQSTLDAKELVEKYKNSSDFTVGGPFGLDNAVSEEAATVKGVKGPVAGKADILIFNDIGAANVMYKSLICFSAHKNAGVVIGTSYPIIMTSRSEAKESKLNCIKLGVLLLNKNKHLHIASE